MARLPDHIRCQTPAENVSLCALFTSLMKATGSGWWLTTVVNRSSETVTVASYVFCVERLTRLRNQTRSLIARAGNRVMDVLRSNTSA